jgi:hypothetical protein
LGAMSRGALCELPQRLISCEAGLLPLPLPAGRRGFGGRSGSESCETRYEYAEPVSEGSLEAIDCPPLDSPRRRSSLWNTFLKERSGPGDAAAACWGRGCEERAPVCEYGDECRTTPVDGATARPARPRSWPFP